MKVTLLPALLIASVAAIPSLHDALTNTWKGIKQRNIDPYDVKLVHRPRSETPNDAVSEGVGYGLILALYHDDQKYFNMIFEAAEHYMWSGTGYDWRVDEYGNKVGTGSATDADQDVAFALIGADVMVKRGLWAPYTSPSYMDRAQSIMNNLWDSHMITLGHNVAPGVGFGGDSSFLNPSYNSPAWYRIFKEVDAERHNWDLVIQRSYDLLMSTPGYKKGLVPDWVSATGDVYYGSLSYNTFGEGRYLFKDAIRIFWRFGTDYLWFKDPRARQFLENAYAFLTSKGGPSAANFYQMDGELVPEGDTWTFDGGRRTRYRREHSPLTVGMWSIVPYVLGKPDVVAYERELMRFYQENSTYWGLTTGPETIDINELYYDQFLAAFGGLVLNGTWVPPVINQ